MKILLVLHTVHRSVTVAYLAYSDSATRPFSKGSFQESVSLWVGFVRLHEFDICHKKNQLTKNYSVSHRCC
jgi:hypothetical protein